jgi:hypothetical protein
MDILYSDGVPTTTFSAFRSQAQPCEAKMLDAPENNLLLAAGEYAKQPAEPDDGGCFEPFIPQVSVSTAPEPAPKPKPSPLVLLTDEILRDYGCVPTPTDTTPKTEFPAPAASGSAGNAEMAQPSEFLPPPVEAPHPAPRMATAVELFTWMRKSLLERTNLPETAAELVVFWVISTYFQDALTILPCLVLTGIAHDAWSVLHVLGDFCRCAALLPGLRQCDLGPLRWGYQSNLISEPHLDKRTADLLSNLTDHRFLFVERGSFTRNCRSTAIYAGENPEPHRIQNSIHIHIAPTKNAAPSAPPKWPQKMIARVPVHLDQYRNENLSYVQHSTWLPPGLSSETATIATALGRVIVNAPELRQRLVALLKSQDRQRLSELSNTTEAIVLEAIRTLSRDGREHAYAWEIAAQANRLLEARGETARLSPEKVGHRLKKLGLRTRPLSQAGNGLTFDKATLGRIQQLAEVYSRQN